MDVYVPPELQKKKWMEEYVHNYSWGLPHLSI